MMKLDRNFPKLFCYLQKNKRGLLLWRRRPVTAQMALMKMITVRDASESVHGKPVKNGARPGLIMPGTPLKGARYYQEIAER